MTIVIMTLMLVGAGAVFGIPVRLFQLVRGSIQTAYSRLSGLSKIVAVIGLVGLTLSALLWMGVAYVAVMVVTDDTTPRIWGGSELAMITSALGFLYLMAELLLLPVTIRQIRNVRVASA